LVDPTELDLLICERYIILLLLILYHTSYTHVDSSLGPDPLQPIAHAPPPASEPALVHRCTCTVGYRETTTAVILRVVNSVLLETGFEVGRAVSLEDGERAGALRMFFVEGLGEEAVLSIGEGGSGKNTSVQVRSSTMRKPYIRAIDMPSMIRIVFVGAYGLVVKSCESWSQTII
jgi:hypothetical protein